MCISIQYLMNRSVFLLRRVRPLSVLPGTELRRVSLTEHVIQGIWIFFRSHPVKNYLDHGFLPFCRLALRFQPDDFCQQIYLLLRQCNIPAVLCTGRRLCRRRLALCRLRCLCFPRCCLYFGFRCLCFLQGCLYFFCRIGRRRACYHCSGVLYDSCRFI